MTFHNAHRLRRIAIAYCCLILVTAAVSTGSAFQIQPSAFMTRAQGHYSALSQPLALHMSSSSSSSMSATSNNNNSNADFEFQELKVQLNAMKRDRIPSRDLLANKRQELTHYVDRVVLSRPSPVPLQSIGEVLPGTQWRLGFSTEEATLGDLPRDADVYLEFDADDDSKLDYVLQFGKKTLGLNRLTAKSSYTVDSSPVNPGLVTFVYDDITTDVFGLSNLSVGFFGLLKGRANYVESAYFDGRLWIERGTSPEGQVYYNVYVRKEGNDEW